MPILGPQREAPFCGEGGRLVLLIAREGNGVMGAIFPTGPRRRVWRVRWACRSASRRPDGPRLATDECYSTGGKDKGSSSAARGPRAPLGLSEPGPRPSLWGSCVPVADGRYRVPHLLL
ncbi:hypothetical protein NN561_004860 [Cricetulus griseus]